MNPNDPLIQIFSAWIQSCVSKPERGLPAPEMAVRLNPCHPGWYNYYGVVTLNAAKRAEADFSTGQAQAAILAADFHSAMALRRWRWVAGAERLERGGTKRLRTAENTLTNRCRYWAIENLASPARVAGTADANSPPDC